jgi:nucleoside triphosphate pyrophosphatase
VSPKLAQTTIVLASTSPARQALLAAAGIPFEAVAPGVEESANGDPVSVAEHLARAKAEAVAAKRREAIVVGSDQVLSFGGRAYGKPANRAAARGQLAMLSGARHELVTAVCVVSPRGTEVAHDVARLEMRALTDGEIDRYLETGEWQGCAGGYRIEGRGILLFSRVEGDFTGIRGLPMLLVGRMLRAAGATLP